MENSKNNNSEIMCQHCGKRIIATNFLLHEARCNLISSRARRQEDNIKQQRFPQSNHSRTGRYEEIKPSFSQRRPEVERKKIFNEPVRSEEEDKISCSYCGYKQTFLELDTHPNECPARGEPCTYCGQLFPEPLMNQHKQLCSERVPPQHANHIHHEQDIHNFEDYGEEFEQDEDQFHYHPFGNLSFIFGGNQFGNGSRQPVFRRIQAINGRTVVEESDGRGGMIRRQTYDRQGEPSFRNVGREQIFGRRNGNPFHDFVRLVGLMALRSGQPEQGLTKDELKKLTKIKYKPENSTGQKDLCTICYCQFEKDQRIIQLKCKHMYHEECIIKWLEKNVKCPVCKAPQTNRPINREE